MANTHSQHTMSDYAMSDYAMSDYAMSDYAMSNSQLRQSVLIEENASGKIFQFFCQKKLIAFLLLFFVPILSGCGFNTIPTNEEKAKAAWSEVLNQYQRRSDLIPNLVQTVKGYASHEQQVLTDVVEARAKATQSNINANMLDNPQAMQQFLQNQTGLSGALSRLMAITENYPDLKANQNFLSLQSQLEGTENRIAIARRDYIESVRVYNTALRTMPTMVWTWLWYRDAKPLPTFDIAPEAQEIPKVEFN